MYNEYKGATTNSENFLDAALGPLADYSAREGVK